MKVRRLTIEGFRGAPKPVVLDLAERSLCLLGENGSGKTTVVDALELWATGDLEAFHRHHCGLDAAIHLDAASASVTVEGQAIGSLTRTLVGSKASKLRPNGPSALTSDPPPIPILRHRTMADFMSRSAGEKRKALLDLFGLGALEVLRAAIVTAANEARRRSSEAQQEVKNEAAGVSAIVEGGDVLAVARRLLNEAGVERTLSEESDIARAEIASAPASVPPDRTALIAELARTAEAADVSALTAWNEALKDESATRASALAALLKSGEDVLMDWRAPACPLCLSAVDTAQLATEIAHRRAEYLEASESLEAARQAMAKLSRQYAEIEAALAAIQRAAPETGWPPSLSAAAEALGSAFAEVKRALAEQLRVDEACAAFSLPPEVLPDITAAAQAVATGDVGTEALRKFITLQEASRRLEGAKRQSQLADVVAASVEGAKEIVSQAVTDAIEAAVSSIGQLAASYYSKLMPGGVYHDVRIVATDEYAGGAEFELTYDARHTVSPPQRVLSESQLNALGLAFFLAWLKTDTQPWRVVVLDDVVNSFSAHHRMGLAKLLHAEFAEWQILLFTHDGVFFDVVQRVTAGEKWRHQQVAAWTPTGGPVFADGDAAARLRERLDAGESAADLGGLARIALERALSHPLWKLELPVRYDPHLRQGAGDFITGLRLGLKGSALSEALSIVKRMEAQTYLSNLGAHDKPGSPGLTRADLYEMLTDIADLDAGFRCSGCGAPVWHARKGSGFYCGCPHNLAL